MMETVPPYAISLDSVDNVVKLYQSHDCDIRIVGSFGRAAVLGSTVVSYSDRPYPIRDLDFIILNRNSAIADSIKEQARELSQPHFLDEVFVDKIVTEGDKTSINYKDISVEIDPSIFEPYEGNLYGLSIPSLKPGVLLALTSLYGPFRPKDFVAALDFARKARELFSLSDEEFTAFHELNRLRKKEYPMDSLLASLRWEYHQRVSGVRREQLSGLTDRMRTALKHTVGWIDNQR